MSDEKPTMLYPGLLGSASSGGLYSGGSLAGYPSTAPSYTTCGRCGTYHMIGTEHHCVTYARSSSEVMDKLQQIHYELTGRIVDIDSAVANTRGDIERLEGRIQSLTEVLYSLLASFKELKR